jgi:hypothetical protein
MQEYRVYALLSFPDVAGGRGPFQLRGTDLLQLRWNPFYDYVEARVLEFTGRPGQ